LFVESDKSYCLS